MPKQQTRCAIYTRKSSEEGLEQSFNSLDAQREACIAYIQSQKHEGWVAVEDFYDDGGFSGGTMERPALKRLLADIVGGEVETVIVYKVDRLTRSLADFAKIIEVFDSHGISFVSVTQQFNTTTSMGRLTLNVLLSFAQFERELTGERIRDKVAASKKKGMWMGGSVPFGYDCVKHCLVVNHADAEKVREIFKQYAQLGTVRKLREYLNQRQIRSKVRTSNTGRISGGTIYSRGALFHLLNNRVYIGEIVHRGQSHPGQHEAIVAKELWNKVAARLQVNNQSHRKRKPLPTSSLLSGKLFDVNGVRFTPTHAVKSGTRYRYYTSQTVIQHSGTKPAVARLPAAGLEDLVSSQIYSLLLSPEKCIEGLGSGPEIQAFTEKIQHLADRWQTLEVSERHSFVRTVVKRVVINQSTVWTEVDRTKLLDLLGYRTTGETPGPDVIKLTAGFRSASRGGEMHIVADGTYKQRPPIPSLVKALAYARDWYEQIVSGEVGTVAELSRKTGFPAPYVQRILQCAMLSPQVTEMVLSGEQPPTLTLSELSGDIANDWQEQKLHGWRGRSENPQMDKENDGV